MAIPAQWSSGSSNCGIYNNETPLSAVLKSAVGAEAGMYAAFAEGVQDQTSSMHS